MSSMFSVVYWKFPSWTWGPRAATENVRRSRKNVVGR